MNCVGQHMENLTVGKGVVLELTPFVMISNLFGRHYAKTRSARDPDTLHQAQQLTRYRGMNYYA